VKFLLSAVCCLFLAWGLTGCISSQQLQQDVSNIKTQIANNPATVTAIVQQGVTAGLKKWAADHKTDASLAATAIHQVIGTNFAQYLNGGALNVDAAALATLKAGLGSNLPPGSEALVAVIGGLVDLQVQAPAAGEYLDAQDLIILQATVKGVDQACVSFLAAK
jgi:hypothetical protein